MVEYSKVKRRHDHDSQSGVELMKNWKDRIKSARVAG
jgi:hypothetical protein